MYIFIYAKHDNSYNSDKKMIRAMMICAHSDKKSLCNMCVKIIADDRSLYVYPLITLQWEAGCKEGNESLWVFGNLMWMVCAIWVCMDDRTSLSGYLIHHGWSVSWNIAHVGRVFSDSPKFKNEKNLHISNIDWFLFYGHRIAKKRSFIEDLCKRSN